VQTTQPSADKQRLTVPETKPVFNPQESTVKHAAEAGKPCPRCQQGIMDYDGLLNLVCPVCGYTEGGGCT